MYQINESFNNAMHSYIVQPLIRGTVGDVSFSHADILEGSFRCCNQCVTVNDVKVGGVFVGEIQLTLLKSIANSRGDWYGKKIRPEYGLMADGEAEFIPCPSYEYTINEATWTEDGLKIVAYDNMLLLDKQAEIPQSSGFAWDWLVFISERTGLRVGMTEFEVAQMPNGSKVLGLTDSSKIETYRDLVSFLAAVLAGYATINREGALVIRQFGSTVVDTIDAENRFTGCSFSDYVTRYTGLSAVNSNDSTVEYIHVNPDDGLTMKLGTNPFLQLGTETERLEIREAILHSIQAFKYVPFKASMLGCCAYDLGDLIRFTDGIAGDSIGCIMAFDFGLNDYAVSGFGANPALENAQSKTDKNIAGITKQQTSEQLAVTMVTNVSEVGISEDWTRVGTIAFAVSKPQTVLFHAVSKHNLEVGGVVRYKYVLNDQELDFIHEVNCAEGIDTATLFIPFEIGTVNYRFEVFVSSPDAVGTIERINMRGAIIGAGIVGTDWDGTLSFYDVFSVELVGGFVFPFVDDLEPLVVVQEPSKAGAVDSFGLSLERGYSINFADNFRIITTIPEYNVITESGEVMFVENGDYLITE